MKKLMYGVCMLGLLAMISTSCKKNEQQGTSFTVSTTPYVEEDMKAYFHPSNFYFVFEEGDQIKVYNIDDNNPQNSVASIFHVNGTGTGTQTINGTAVGEMMSAYYAFYPASMAPSNELLKKTNKDHFELKGDQYAFEMEDGSYTVGGEGVPMCAKSTDGLHFQFYNICGICNIRLTGNTDKVVTSIELTDNTVHLSGWVEFYLNKVDKDQIETLKDLYTSNNPAFETQYAAYLQEIGYKAHAYDNADYKMVYHCDNLASGGVQLSQGNPANFRIGLRPMALAGGFTYKVFFDDGTACTVTKYQNVNRAYAMVPGTVKTFAINVSTPGDDAPYISWD